MIQTVKISESGDRHQSQVNLVTYSGADLEKVTSRESLDFNRKCIPTSLRKVYNSTCAEECKGQWIHSAHTLLA